MKDRIQAFADAAGITDPIDSASDSWTQREQMQHFSNLLQEVATAIRLFDKYDRLDVNLRDAATNSLLPILNELTIYDKSKKFLFALCPFREGDRNYLGFITGALTFSQRTPIAFLEKGQTKLSDENVANIFAKVGGELRLYLRRGNAPVAQADSARPG